MRPDITFGVAVTAAAVAACRQPSARVAAPPPIAGTPLAAGATEADAAHLLARLTFGARPGDAHALVQRGLAEWLDLQLAPGAILDTAGLAALAPFQDALRSPEALRGAAEAAVAAQTAADASDPPDHPQGTAPLTGPAKQAKRREKRTQVLEAQMTAVARHVASERQLFEVMVDVWTNHFSVSLQKGPVRYLAADFVERAIRPHALGKFGDLLKASARHPAMLVYLDNAQSVVPPPGSNQARKGRGLNENYARELLELHTVGVAGGYTQADVIAVARVLSGWGVVDGDFTFRARMHDDGEKTVMGTAFPPHGGEEEGVRLLAMLAAHPATITHVCTQLCARLVADDPPGSCVAAAAAAWRASDGDLASVVRAIVNDAAFWSPAVRGSKVKSPLELVVSAVRALGGEVDGVGLATAIARLGQPLLLAPAPTGYADTREAWLSTASALERMDLALAFGDGRAPGVDLDLDLVLPLQGAESLAAWQAQTITRLDGMVPGGLAPTTRDVIAKHLGSPKRPEQARALGLALALASPEFQRQ